MPQIVSKALADGNHISLDPMEHNRWRRPITLAFHGAVASTYGFAICWQNVSEASHILYMGASPMMRIYGKWRFLTYNCLIMQFIAYSLCVTSHFIPRLRRSRDFFFTTFAFPVGLLVVTSFWSIWFIAGREYIFPASVEPYYPPWLNHVTHSIIAPINLVELLINKKGYSSDKLSLYALTGYTLSYTSFLLYIRWKTGCFVYPSLNDLDAVSVGAIITSMIIFGIGAYKLGKSLHDYVHKLGSTKNRIKSNRKVE